MKLPTSTATASRTLSSDPGAWSFTWETATGRSGPPPRRRYRPPPDTISRTSPWPMSTTTAISTPSRCSMTRKLRISLSSSATARAASSSIPTPSSRSHSFGLGPSYEPLYDHPDPRGFQRRRQARPARAHLRARIIQPDRLSGQRQRHLHARARGLQRHGLRLRHLLGDLNGDGGSTSWLSPRRLADRRCLSGRRQGRFPAERRVRQRLTLSNTSPADLALGDFNGDGHLDLAVSYSDFFANPTEVDLFTGDGAGHFAARRWYCRHNPFNLVSIPRAPFLDAGTFAVKDQPPTAENSTTTAVSGSSITIPVLDNATNPDGAPLTIDGLTSPPRCRPHRWRPTQRPRRRGHRLRTDPRLHRHGLVYLHDRRSCRCRIHRHSYGYRNAQTVTRRPRASRRSRGADLSAALQS